MVLEFVTLKLLIAVATATFNNQNCTVVRVPTKA